MPLNDKIISQLESYLEYNEIETYDTLTKAEEGIKLTKLALQKMQKNIESHQFKNKQEEAFYFKKNKPQVYSKLIYYVKLFNIESKRPRSSNKSQIKYLNKHIDKLQDYFNDNLEFYHYYRRNATFLDE